MEILIPVLTALIPTCIGVGFAMYYRSKNNETGLKEVKDSIVNQTGQFTAFKEDAIAVLARHATVIETTQKAQETHEERCREDKREMWSKINDKQDKS